MDELTRWYIDLGLSIGTFIVSLIVAFLLFWYEKRRDDSLVQQTKDFNNWMKGQTERMTSILEALQKYIEKAPSKPERRRLADRIERLFPGSVQIGETIIRRPSLRIAQAFIGGAVMVEALAIGDEGEQLHGEISKIKEGKIINYVSPEGERFLTEVKSVRIEKETIDETIAYHFYIGLQIRR